MAMELPFGGLAVTYFFSIALGAWLSPIISRLFGRSQSVTLAVVFACLAGLQIILALQGSVAGFVAVFILFSILLGVSETPASSILHRCVDYSQRSTMPSLRSLIQQLGAAVDLILAGAVAEIYGTPVAWIVGALFLAVAAILLAILANRHVTRL